MLLQTFKLERYFAEHEFTAKHLLSPSDCESMALPDLVALADDGDPRALGAAVAGLHGVAGAPVAAPRDRRAVHGLTG